VSAGATLRTALDPGRLQKHLGKAVLVVGVALTWFGLKDVRFARIAPDDDSTPSVAPGSRVLVRTLEQDGGELQRGALYLCDLTGRARELAMLRLARLIALEGDRIERRDDRHGDRVVVAAGEREFILPREIAALLPEVVPERHALLLTDNPASRHLDSRALGALPIERLKLRVVSAIQLPLR